MPTALVNACLILKGTRLLMNNMSVTRPMPRPRLFINIRQLMSKPPLINIFMSATLNVCTAVDGHIICMYTRTDADECRYITEHKAVNVGGYMSMMNAQLLVTESMK